MIRGSISGCSGQQAGGVILREGSNSFIDVLINDCHAFGTTEYDSTGIPILIGGGGICIRKGTLIMSGGAIRNCHAPHGNGGGIKLADGGVRMELSGVTVQGCTAEYGGGMYLEENTDARLIDVRIEDCEALAEHCCASGRGGGGMFMRQGSTLRAELTRPHGQVSRAAHRRQRTGA